MHEKQAVLRKQFGTLLNACASEQRDNLRTAVKNARLVGDEAPQVYKNAAFMALIHGVGALINDVAADNS